MNPPRATYRLQLHEGFTLGDAERLVPYLARMGITHVYLSPIAQATRGSEHGYDVTDPTQVADALGGLEALGSLARALASREMGVLLDIVPNHMAASTENEWWADLLRNGAASMHAATFDTPLTKGGADRLRLPVLGQPLEEVVARGELRVRQRADRPVLQYYDHWYPVPDDAVELAAAVARGHAPLQQLLEAVPYELTDWRSVNDSVCYRRFFDITGLIGVRVEDTDVFARTHAGILQWLADGCVDALRIDHIDGLRDPARYLEQLARAAEQARGGEHCYTVVEKILAPDEQLPEAWRAEGTTGYEFIRLASGYLLDPDGYARLDQLRREVTGEQRSFNDFVRACKQLVLRELFPAELADVAQRVSRLAGTPLDATASVLRELTVELGVYRTYISERGASAEDRRRIMEAHAAAVPHVPADRRPVLDAVCETLLLDRVHASAEERADALDATARWQQMTGPVMAKGFEDTALYAWPTLLALNEVGGEPGAAFAAASVHAFLSERARRTPHALNATSTHDTKRSEDVRARLLVLAEHARTWTDAIQKWRPALYNSDARLSPRDELVLLQTLVGAWPLDSSPDDAFTERIQAFMLKAAREAKQETSWREQNEEYERLLSSTVAHLLTAPSTAPLRTELQHWVDRTALHGAGNALMQILLKCTAPGVPDVYRGTESWRFDLVDPDNRRPVDYAVLERQASELGPLVRSPSMDAVRALLHAWRDGRIKQYVLMAALACRARNPALGGDYHPVTVEGGRAEHVLAFRRSAGSAQALAIITRWPARLAPADELPAGAVWQDTFVRTNAQSSTAWRCTLTGRQIASERGAIRLADALDPLPLALLESG